MPLRRALAGRRGASVSTFDQFVEHVANGYSLSEAARAVKIPYLYALHWWDIVCRDLGPQAV